MMTQICDISKLTFHDMMQTNQVLLRQADAILFKSTVQLPVGGRTGVEDVLFGREQRQAVGIKVDRSRAHDGKSFQTTPAAAASLFTGPDGFRGRSICWKTATAEKRGSFTAEKTASKVRRLMQSGL